MILCSLRGMSEYSLLGRILEKASSSSWSLSSSATRGPLWAKLDWKLGSGGSQGRGSAVGMDDAKT